MYYVNNNIIIMYFIVIWQKPGQSIVNFNNTGVMWTS